MATGHTAVPAQHPETHEVFRKQQGSSGHCWKQQSLEQCSSPCCHQNERTPEAEDKRRLPSGREGHETPAAEQRTHARGMKRDISKRTFSHGEPGKANCGA